MKSNWNYPTTIWAGENRFNEILNACSLLKFKNLESRKSHKCAKVSKSGKPKVK